MSIAVRASEDDGPGRDTSPLLGSAGPSHAADDTSLSVLGMVVRCRRQDRPRLVGLLLSGAAAAALGILAVIAAVGSAHFGRAGPRPVRNVVLMVSDGFGPASQTLARNYNQFVNKLPAGAQLPLDTILVGSSRTRSSSSFVTDSAAGATAFACAIKTYNGAIGVDPDSVPCGTVLEAAKARGMFTGLVVTSRITHATPASFSAHVSSRGDEDEIAIQQIGNYSLGRRVDLMFGGGLCHFLPNTTSSSCRPDQTNVLAQAAEIGWKIGTDRAFFDSIVPDKAQLPIMNLFNLDHMSYNIDRDPTVEPSLAEMSAKALATLEAVSHAQGTGFFLMIEGSRIDMAAHTNDPAPHIHEILQYNEAVAAVKAFVDKHPDTVMISVSDHETGGLSVGLQRGPAYPIYAWFPEALTGVHHSAEFIVRKLKAFTGPNIADFISTTVFGEWLGGVAPTDADIKFLSNTTQAQDQMENYIGKITSDLAGLGWSTHGHSAVDVNLYVHGAKAHELFGNHENTEIGDFIVRNLHLDLRKITDELKSAMPQMQSRISGKRQLGSLNFNERHFHSSTTP
ncbi:vacuolar alkaline phosphatase [Polyrhizophydium stewartii]|uniref:Alkaline phosphatase n=1 Tax=Polyrhizophydium stewartii TaxID=2732419 RepID=A0ABR4NJP7_9FUNG|nr:hypothetical protein HK105_007182 [Polyrhizophydium stewartii]